MTPTQYLTLMSTLRRVEEKVDAVEERLSFVYPTDDEMTAQLDAELQSILAPGGSIRVFEDDV